MALNDDTKLRRQVERHVDRMEQAEKDRPTLLAHTVFLGTLGLVFVIPIIIGAYLGRWLDEMVTGYSIQWTMSLILLGIVIGAVNVYLLIRE